MDIVVGVSNYVECLVGMEVGFSCLETVGMALSTIIPLPDRDFWSGSCMPTYLLLPAIVSLLPECSLLRRFSCSYFRPKETTKDEIVIA